MSYAPFHGYFATDATDPLGKAGGRSSICRELLATEGTETDDPSVFGEEAHIVSAAPGGPRHGALPDHDVYDNLILLCSTHHKQVDDQVASYPLDALKRIKKQHEDWVAAIGDTNRPLKFVPDPEYPVPNAVKVFTTARSLWDFMGNAESFNPSWPDGLTDEQQDLVDVFVENPARITTERSTTMARSGTRGRS